MERKQAFPSPSNSLLITKSKFKYSCGRWVPGVQTDLQSLSMATNGKPSGVPQLVTQKLASHPVTTMEKNHLTLSSKFLMIKHLYLLLLFLSKKEKQKSNLGVSEILNFPLCHAQLSAVSVRDLNQENAKCSNQLPWIGSSSKKKVDGLRLEEKSKKSTCGGIPFWGGPSKIGQGTVVSKVF